jgi:L-aminopeptidase/D-esterase-like protein
MKSGLGCHALQVGRLKIGAVVAVNCLGDILDPSTGERLAGPLDEGIQRPVSTEEIMVASYAERKNLFSGNTTIGVVTTNAGLTKAEAGKTASMAQNGFATTIRPAHSMYDGDTIFALSTGDIEAELSTVGFLAARVVERAVVCAVKNAQPLCGLVCYSELPKNRSGRP